MVLQLTSLKIARCNSHTKAFTGPTPDQTEHKIHLKYLACANEDEHMTFLEWLCEYDHEKNPPKRYRDAGWIEAFLRVQPAVLLSTPSNELSAPQP